MPSSSELSAAHLGLNEPVMAMQAVTFARVIDDAVGSLKGSLYF